MMELGEFASALAAFEVYASGSGYSLERAGAIDTWERVFAADDTEHAYRGWMAAWEEKS